MKMLAMVCASLAFTLAGGTAPLMAQDAYGPCYEAYVFNTEYCNSDASCNQRTVDRIYQECLETGVVEYI